MQTETKYFIITAGATGSGKTGLILKTAETLGLKLEEGNYAKILVDDLVETDPKYKAKIDEILMKIKRECEGREECEKIKLENPTQELLKEFGSAYFNTRQAKGCGLADVDPKIGSCDEENDANLKNAIDARKHVIFEFTGGYIPTWLLDEKYIPQGYTIVLSYTLVNIDELIKRNKSRAYSAVKEYESAEKTQELRAPRLPDISKENFTKVLNTIKTVLLDIYDSCIKLYNSDICGPRQIDRLLLFNNNGNPMINIFDSDRNKLDSDAFSTLIEPFFPATKAEGGKSRNKRSKSKRRKAGKKRTLRNRNRRNK
jgi:cytidylate kinase